jgi:hypothetical protein
VAFDLADYEQAAVTLTSDQLERLLEFQVLTKRNYPHWEGIDDRMNVVCTVLVRRGVNPHWILKG